MRYSFHDRREYIVQIHRIRRMLFFHGDAIAYMGDSTLKFKIELLNIPDTGRIPKNPRHILFNTF